MQSMVERAQSGKRSLNPIALDPLHHPFGVVPLPQWGGQAPTASARAFTGRALPAALARFAPRSISFIRSWT